MGGAVHRGRKKGSTKPLFTTCTQNRLEISWNKISPIFQACFFYICSVTISMVSTTTNSTCLITIVALFFLICISLLLGKYNCNLRKDFFAFYLSSFLRNYVCTWLGRVDAAVLQCRLPKCWLENENVDFLGPLLTAPRGIRCPGDCQMVLS
jgi:hypothetical protein